MGDHDEKRMLGYLTKVLSANLPVRLETDASAPNNELYDKLYELLRQINEVNVFLPILPMVI